MARSKSNPNSTGMMVLLGAAAVGVYGYLNGWFTSFMPSTVALAPTPTSTGGNPIMNPGTQIVNAPSAVLPVGTVANTGNDIAAQATAKLAYIVPGRSAVSQAPSGYMMVKVSDVVAAPAGVIYLRNDIAQKDVDTANAVLALTNQVAKATWDAQYAMNPETAGPMPAPAPQIDMTTLTLQNLQSGVSGLGQPGFYRRKLPQDWRM